MRSLLIIAAALLAASTGLFAQSDYISLDKQTYDYYLKGDYNNLKKTAGSLLSQGIDYYYLRMRLGILSYNNEHYSSASKHFKKALEFNSSDTLSRDYIYYSYLYSGRKADAGLYLESIPRSIKSNGLKLINKDGLEILYAGFLTSGSDVTLYKTNNLYYEAVKNSLSFNAGFENYFSPQLKGTFAFTNFQKHGTAYSVSDTSGIDLNFTQNQVYAKLTGFIFPGWEFSGFVHTAFYSAVTTVVRQSRTISTFTPKMEYAGGGGISKNGWKIRAGANISLSNFGSSNQVRGEGYFTWLPFGNLNLYLTSGGMYQTDVNWGETYQINQEIGLKVLKTIWLESGIVKGNSFLYTRNQGFIMNNSFQTPATILYANIIILPLKHFRLTVTPFFAKNEIYSWDLNGYTRTDKLISNSFGGSIKLIYKNK